MNSTENFYVEREADRLLWDAFQKWRGSSWQEAYWVSLLSSPGRGNTALIKHFCEQFARDPYLSSTARLISVDAGDDAISDLPPQALGPIARKTLDLHRVAVRSWPMRLKTWLQNDLRPLLNKFVLTFLLIFVMVLVYEMHRPLRFLSYSWWGSAIAHLSEHPEILLKELVVALLAAVLIEVWKKKRQEAQRTADEEADRREIESYRHCGPGLSNGLMDLCRGFSALVLLVDNAHALPDEEKHLLQDFVDPSPRRDAIRQFMRCKRVLLITVDLESPVGKLPTRAGQGFRQVKVSPLTRMELQDILKHSDIVLPDGEEQWLLDLAEQNVKALFFEEHQELTERVLKEFTQERNAGIRGLFGHCELMAFWAVRQEPLIEKVKLLDWLKCLDGEYLRMFDLRPPESARCEDLVRGFAKSSLVRVDGQTFYFDAAACKALRKWMEQSIQEKQLLAQVHYYWLMKLARSIGPTRIPVPRTYSDNEQSDVKQAAWHAVKLGRLLDNGSDVIAKSTLTPEQRSERQYDTVDLLLTASQMWRLDGDVDEAQDMVLEALEWLPSATSDRQRWLSLAAGQLWASYWVSANPKISSKLQSITLDCPAVSTEARWVIQQRFEKLMTGQLPAATTETEPPFDEPDLVNVHRLIGVLRSIREAHGFTSEGLRDVSIPIPEPVPAGEYLWAEFALWELRASALNRRGDLQNLNELLSKWSERLRANDSYDAPIGIDAYQEYHQARYQHVLLECWKLQADQTRYLSDEEAGNVMRAVERWLEERCPIQPVSRAPMRDRLFEQAQDGYRRALQIAALIDFRALLLEGSFHLGDLLLRFTPDATRETHQFWWKEWVRLFEACLLTDRTLGWNMHVPDIYRMQWKFFEKVDRPTSLTDAYNTLNSARRCGYPNIVVLACHKRVSEQFTNYADSTEDRKRSAELHEMWARNLAALPEASEYRQFRRSLSLEQALTLQYAAQAERLVNDFGRAKQLLDEADSLFQSSIQSDHHEDSDAVRDLGVGIRMQRAWLVDAKGDDAPVYRRLIRELWRDLEPGCQHDSNALGSLLSIEDDEKLLDDAWPLVSSTEANIDPDNPSLSLPSEWFHGSHPVTVRNRYEYRFRQLLRLGSERANPTSDELDRDAQIGWKGQERFGETTLTFAQLDLRRGYSTACRGMMITLLEAVARDFKERREGQNEMTSYRRLMEYEPEVDRYRSSYIDVLIEQKELLDRELKVLGFDRMDWLSVAERLDHYFSILVDEDLLKTKAVEQIQESGRTGKEFESRQKQLKDALERAQAYWRNGARKECLDTLDPALNFSRQSWVFLPQLEALDLWLRCAQSVHEPLVSKLSDRAALLRSLTLQYIGQLAKTIREPRAQQLANQLLEVLQSEQVSRAP